MTKQKGINNLTFVDEKSVIVFFNRFHLKIIKLRFVEICSIR